MAYITTGLTNGGITTHYAFSYDEALEKTMTNPGGLEPDRTNNLIAVAEADFNLMSGWFNGIALPFTLPVSVQVANDSGGAGWGPPITLKPGSEDANYCRYLMVSEVSEMLMYSQNKGWFAPDGSNEQSCGEGLSRFLAQQFLTLEGLGSSEPGYAISPSWLNSSLPTSNPSSTQVIGTTNYGSRADYVNNTLEFDHGIDPSTGCSMLFLYWLQVQRAHSLHAIVTAAPGSDQAASCLRGVYKNLTGDLSRDPFPPFKATIALSFPEDEVSSIGGPNPDNPFPIWANQFAMARPASTAANAAFAVLNRVPGQEELFWNSSSADISSNWRNDDVDNGAWHTQFAVANAGSVRADSHVATLARFPQQEEVFWVGAVGDVSSNWRNDNVDNGAWHSQFAIASPGSVRAASPLAVLARFPQQEEVFWIAADGNISSNWRNDTVDSGAWHSQFGIANPGAARADSPLAVLARLPQQEEAFWVGMDGSISSNWRNDNVDNGAWHSPFALAGSGSARAGSPLAVLARFPQQEEVFWIGAAGDVSSNWRNDTVDNGAWHSPFAVANPGSVRAGSPLVVLARFPQQEEVFWIGAVGDVSSNWRNDAVDNGAWHSPFALTSPGSVRSDSPLAVVARTPTREDVFWVGTEAAVWNAWRDDAIDGGAWHPALRISQPNSVQPGSPLFATARVPDVLEVFWVGAVGDLSSTILA